MYKCKMLKMNSQREQLTSIIVKKKKRLFVILEITAMDHHILHSRSKKKDLYWIKFYIEKKKEQKVRYIKHLEVADIRRHWQPLGTRAVRAFRSSS